MSRFMLSAQEIKDMQAGSYIRYKDVSQVYRFKGLTRSKHIDGNWVDYYSYTNDATGDTYSRLANGFEDFTLVTTHG